MFLSKNPPRSSSPVNREKLAIFTKDIPVGISRDFFQETGDSTRSLLAPIYDDRDALDEQEFSPDEDENIDDSRVMVARIKSHQSNEADNANFKEEKLIENESNIIGKRSMLETDNKEKAAQDAEILSSKSYSGKFRNETSTRKSKNTSFMSTSSSSSSSSSTDSQFSLSFSSSTATSTTRSKSLPKCNRTQHTEVKGKTWDDWFIEKAILEIERIKLVKAKQKKLQEERLKETEEKVKKDVQVEQNRKDWLHQKAFELEKIKREKLAQKEFEQLKEKQEKELLDEKAKQKFKEWCSMKDEENNKIRSKLKIEKKLRREENEIKKAKAEEAYRTWLRDNRKKRRKGDINKFEIYENPKPNYTNPIPWVSMTDNDDVSQNVKDRQNFCSPPLLWQDVEERRKKQQNNKQILRKSRLPFN